MSRTALALLLLTLAGLSAALFWALRSSGFGAGDDMTFSRFVRDLDADQVERLHVNGSTATGRTKDGKTFRVVLPYIDPQLADDMAEHTEVTFSESWSDNSTPLWWAVPLALMIGYLAGKAAGPAARG